MTISEEMDSMRAGLEMLLAAVQADDPKREILVRVGDLIREAKSLTAALSGQVVVLDGWQDISTAPKDGTRIFLFADGCLKEHEGRAIGHWYEHQSVQGWITEAFDCGDYEFTPTHWQKLPPPPAPPAGEVG